VPGSNYLNNSYNSLSGLLGLPIPGATSSGFDQLSEGYNNNIQSGISDLSSRGLVNTGATPELYTEAGSKYSQGAGAVQANAQNQFNQQQTQILNQLLGLGGPALAKSKTDIGQQEEIAGAGVDLFSGLFGTQQSPYSALTSTSSGFLSQPIGPLLSKILQLGP